MRPRRLDRCEPASGFRVERHLQTALVGALLASLAALGTGAAIAQQTPSFEQPTPAMFVARDEDTTIYLFGTIHIVPCVPETNPPDCVSGITPSVLKAITASDEVWMELDGFWEAAITAARMPSTDPEDLYFPHGTGISDYLPPEDIELIAAALAEKLAINDIDEVIAEIEPFMPWALTAVLMDPSLLVDGAWGPGVDFEVDDIARGLGIPIFGFETLEEQLAIVDSLTESIEYQVVDLRSIAVLLRYGVDLAEIARYSYAATWNVWRSGRLEDFAPLVANNNDILTTLGAPDGGAARILSVTESELGFILKEIEAFYPRSMQQSRRSIADYILTDRNLDWMTDIEAMLGRPGTFFVAVGAAHLIAEFGLPALLEEAGATVERLQ